MEKATWIKNAEAQYDAKYVGYYDLPDRPGPFHVFYTETPDRAQGHDNYFGLFWRGDSLSPTLYITSAATIRDARYPAIRFPNGRILCSRYRHDYVTMGEAFLDGGLDYTRCSPAHAPNGHVVVRDGVEFFEPHDQA